MRKSILLIILLIGILLPVNIYAEDNYEYNSIHLSAVFVTSANVEGIGKIKVNYRTFYNGRTKEETVYLLKENNFSMVINTGTINDASYSYGYCMTLEGIADKYGFLPITPEKKYNDERKSIDIVLSVDFNAMNYDGKKYRQNSDVTPQEMIDRKNGVKSTDNSVSTNTQNNETTTTTTEVMISDDPIIIGESTTTTTIIKDTNNKSKSKKEEKEVNYNKLIPIILVAGGILFVFIIITSIKIARSNKRV